MPSPKETLRWLLFSPVPSHTTFESFGSTVTAPSEYEAWSSKTAVHVLPRFSVFQRLPEAAAAYQTLGFFGSTATSEMRPVVRLGPRLRKAIGVNASLDNVGPAGPPVWAERVAAVKAAVASSSVRAAA